MIESAATSLVDWSRAQFALTAMYHWIFVPLTLGLSFIVAMMETIYYRTGREEWKRLTRFWMKLFGINFAIGVATGIILEFEFGTNWSSYSWFVGDIFGAPLAIEGIMAFFLESTFVAVMFFGWNKVSRKFHLVSTWLVAVGANLSALWILVANAWMQNPVGMVFNPETARNEMVNFMALLFNPVAVDKFLHTIFSGFLLASVFVTGISAWFLLKSRERWLASRSILIASVFGFLSTLMVAFTGDMSTRTIARVQPVKFAAIEALGEGKNNAGLVVLGILGNPGVKINEREIPGFTFKIEVPGLLSFLAGGDNKTHVPGLKELVNGGNPDNKILPVAVRMERGRKAKDILDDYKEAKMLKDEANIKRLAAIFRDNDFIDNYFRYFGYAFLEKPEDAIPDVAVSFYSFRVMVMLGLFFIVLFGMTLILLFRGTLEANRWFLRIAVASIPLAYIASESGWVLSEMGRQPWIIQDLMLVSVAVTNVGTASVITTFILFAILFTALLVAELSIMIKQVKSGP